MATVNFKETVHLKDDWLQEVPPVAGLSFSFDENVNLKDNFQTEIAGGVTDGLTQYLEDEVNLSEDWNFFIGGSLTTSFNETVDLSESAIRDIFLVGEVVFENDEVNLKEELIFAGVTTHIGNFEKNQNISFGDTESPNYKEYSHRFRWTGYNGIAVPDLNYKDLTEPIVRVIPAPSFLQFKYDNSFLLFTRNTINRFLLKADVETGQWRAETDNLIQEFVDLGLMASKTLVLAKDTLYGLSEKGAWKWNKDGLKLISDKIITLPDAGDYEYIGFFCSIRNQYILHRQESSGSVFKATFGTPVDYAVNPESGVSDEAQIRYLNSTHTITVGWKSNSGTNRDSWIGVATINRTAKSITHGTQVSMKPVGGAGGRSEPSVCRMSDSQVVCGVDDSTLPNAGDYSIYVGTISGDTIVLGTAAVIPAITGNATTFRIEKLNSSTFVVFYGTDNASFGLHYRICTISGTTITVGDEVVRINTHVVEPLHTEQVETNKIALLYRQIGSASYVQIASFANGTLTFGAAKSLGGTYQTLALNAPHEQRLFMAYGDVNDIKLKPALIDGIELTLGSTNTYAGLHQAAYPFIGLANRGASGFYLFYTDKANSDYGTAVFGAGGDTAMQLYEETKTVFFGGGTLVAAHAAALGGGLVICNNAQTVTNDGFEQIWGMEFAAIDSFVYQIDHDKWMKFLGIDISDVPVILSGGSLDQNYNLWLDSDKEIQKYPGTIDTTIEAYITTKEFYIREGVFQRWIVDFEGSDVDVETTVFREVDGSDVELKDIKFSVAPNKFRGLALKNQRGRKMSITIFNATVINGLSFDIKLRGER